MSEWGVFLTCVSWVVVAAFVLEAVAFTVVIVWAARFADQGAFEVDLGDVGDAERADLREGKR